jgi:hypothetical protein
MRASLGPGASAGVEDTAVFGAAQPTGMNRQSVIANAMDAKHFIFK